MFKFFLRVFLIGYFVHILIPQTYAAIHISELYPVPEAGKYEWVEVVNTSSDSVNMQGYILRDAASHDLFLPHVILDAGQFIIATASGVLNNSGDTVELVLNGNILESVTYPSGISHLQSYNLCGDQWMIIDSITPGFDTQSCLKDEPTPEHIEEYDALSTILPLPTPQVTIKISPLPSPYAKPNTSIIMENQPIKKKVQSFTEKHRPITSPITVPKQLTPTSVVLRNMKKAPALSNGDDSFLSSSISMIVGIIGAYSIVIGGIIIYRIMKKLRKNSYNDVYDT